MLRNRHVFVLIYAKWSAHFRTVYSTLLCCIFANSTNRNEQYQARLNPKGVKRCLKRKRSCFVAQARAFSP